MADLLAWMTAWQSLPAWLCAARNVVLTRLSCCIRNLLERRLSTWAVCDNVWRSRAMRSLLLLRMALLLALVDSAVEFALTEIATLEHSCPAFHDRFFTFNGVHPVAFLLVTAICAKQLFLQLPTVALGWYTLFASTTKAFVTRPWTCVLATGHHLIANFATAPAGIIVGV